MKKLVVMILLIAISCSACSFPSANDGRDASEMTSFPSEQASENNLTVSLPENDKLSSFSKDEKSNTVFDEMPTGTYAVDGDMASIIIYNENEMRIFGPKEVSAAFMGEYVIEGNNLILSLAEQEDYIFLIEDNDLVLDSGEWLENWVEPGTVFRLSEE